ncbi:hypothetical protein LTR41_002745 [Exophiala xenobiotica]|nr:hypothetical protein LTR41_002745 [Exophiala xenobiotica]
MAKIGTSLAVALGKHHGNIASAVRRVMQAGQVQDLIRDTNHRLIQVDNLYGSGDNVKRERNSFRAVIADYTNGRTVYAGLDDAYGPLSELSTEISNVQHVPNHEEILEAAVDPCVCIKHHHHVYWRLDFDIETSTSDVFRECDCPGTCTNVEIEKQLYKKQNRRWEVAHSVSGNYYQLYSGKPDGAWNPNEPNYPTEDLEYGVGDLWLARYDSSDAKHVYDDGFTGYGSRFDVNARINTRADFSKILENFDAKGQDIVVWYSAHFMHNQMHDVGDTHVVGPNLVPGKWQ